MAKQRNPLPTLDRSLHAAGAGPLYSLARLRHDPASAVSRRPGPASRAADQRASGTTKRNAREGGRKWL